MFICKHTECVEHVHMRAIKRLCLFKAQNTTRFVTAALLFWIWIQRMCFPLLDNVILMRWTVLLWPILKTIWPPRIRVIKEVSLSPAVKYKQGILHLMCLTLCQLCPFYIIILQVILSPDSSWNHMFHWLDNYIKLTVTVSLRWFTSDKITTLKRKHMAEYTACYESTCWKT